MNRCAAPFEIDKADTSPSRVRARTRRRAAFAAFHGVSSLRTFANIRLVRRASRRRSAPL